MGNDLRFEEFLMGFVEYLNRNGFHARPEIVGSIAQAFAKCRIALENEEGVISVLNSFLSTREEEFIAFPELFREYYRNCLEIQKREEEEKERKQKTEQSLHQDMSDMEQKEAELKQKVNLLESELQKKTEELQKESKGILKRTKKQAADLSKAKGRISKKLSCSPEAKKLIEDCLSDQLMLDALSYSHSAVKEAEKELVRLMEEGMKKGDVKNAQVYKTLYDFLKKLEKQQEVCSKSMEQINREIQTRIANCKAKLQRAQRQRDEIQASLDALLTPRSEQVESIILKEKSLHHREIFRSAGKSVMSLKDNAELEKEFSKLTAEEKRLIKQYLDENLLRFKTKLRRNTRTQSRKQLDLKETVRKACQTDGIPVQLCFHRPKPSRTKLVLILDVSGSCKGASHMMLYFMHKLQEAFPGGCHVFVFVNQLYDISDLMSGRDSEAAIQNVLSTIPTQGIYSDYGTPIKQLEKEHKTCFTRESVVIWMGDYRNNKREPELEKFRDLSRKVKKTYLLNTEECEKWDTADSIVSLYKRFASNVYETVNTKELIRFITEYR